MSDGINLAWAALEKKQHKYTYSDCYSYGAKDPCNNSNIKYTPRN
jgi:hypothetical protein